MKFSAWLNSIHLIVIGMIGMVAGMTLLHAYLVMGLLKDMSPGEIKVASYGLGLAISIAVMLCSIHKKILKARALPILFAVLAAVSVLLLLAWDEDVKSIDWIDENPKAYLLSVFSGCAEYSFALLFTNKWEAVKTGHEKLWSTLKEEVDKLSETKRHLSIGIAGLEQDKANLEQKVSELEERISAQSCECGYYSLNPKQLSGHKSHCPDWKKKKGKL